MRGLLLVCCSATESGHGYDVVGARHEDDEDGRGGRARGVAAMDGAPAGEAGAEFPAGGDLGRGCCSQARPVRGRGGGVMGAVPGRDGERPAQLAPRGGGPEGLTVLC